MGKQYKGLFTPVVTPYTPENEINVPEIQKHVEWLLSCGVDGLIPNGSTGESSLLTLDEKTLVCKTVLEVTNHRVPVFGGASADSTAEAIEQAKICEDLGCDGIMAMVPYYSKITQKGVYEHYKAIAESIGIPIMVYNNPARSMLDMSIETIAELAKIKNIRYLKESGGSINRIHKIVRATGGTLAVLSGYDTMALEAFVSGSVGWVASSSNIVPAECKKVTALALKGDFVAARKAYYHVLPMLEAVEESGHLCQALKFLLNTKEGRHVGIARLPLVDMPEPMKDGLLKAYAELH